jgi:Outer membrane protein beta-barrel domain
MAGLLLAVTDARADPQSSPAAAEGFLGNVQLPLSGATSDPVLFPEYSAQSGDMALRRKPTVGAMNLDGDGASAAGVQAAPAFNLRTDNGGAIDRFMRDGDTSGEAWDIGAFVGYQYSDPLDPRYAAGINVQVAADTEEGANQSLLLQPGVDYTMPFSDSIKLNARLYSTYATEETATGNVASTAMVDRITTDGTFRDVGLNLGIGYAVGDKWTIETQAGYTRAIENEPGTSTQKQDENTNQLFGGVIVNYRF